jgi:hypothetical protein
MNSFINTLSNICQVNINVEVASVSSFLLLLYVLSYAKNNKGHFLVAFILVEFIGFSAIFESLTEVQYFLSKMLVYVSLYFVLSRCGFKLKSLLPCVIMVLFQMFMSADAKYYGKSDSFIFINHTYIVTFIHLLIIASLHKWGWIDRIVGNFIRVILGFISSSDAIAFICYNFSTNKKQTVKK